MATLRPELALRLLGEVLVPGADRGGDARLEGRLVDGAS